jgi:hypothetical protein
MKELDSADQTGRSKPDRDDAGRSHAGAHDVNRHNP